LRTSDVLEPYIKQGTIDTSSGSRKDLETFLKKSGKLPDAPGQ
jgi:hypothetical protein